MKYTEQQKKHLKDKKMQGFNKYSSKPLAEIIIKDGFYIIESKLNRK